MGRPPKPIDPAESLTAFYGWKVRTLREQRGWTQTELGKKIALSGDAVSSLELGKSGPDDRTGELLDATFGTGTYFRDHAPLVRKERIPAPARSLAESEATARTIRIYEPALVTGLLQTEDYTRALIMAGLRSDDVDEIVAERKRRQEILVRDRPPRILLVSDEAVFHRSIGGPAVFKSQLDWLVDASARSNVVIQVVPIRAEAYAGLSAGFAVMSTPGRPDVAFVEGPNGVGQFIDQPDKVDQLVHAYDLIRSAALPAVESVQMIKEIRESL